LIVSVRPFEPDDLDAAAVMAERARAQDPAVEPFAQRLALLATGPRTVPELWHVAEGEDGALQGIAFAAVREGKGSVLDVYAAVAPRWRRQGLGRALCAAMLQAEATLRARTRDASGAAFARALGFRDAGAQLQLTWAGGAPPPRFELPALRVRRAAPSEERAQRDYARLANEAWAGAPETFATRADEVAQLLAEQGRLLWFADADGRAVGYLSGVQLGRSLGIEEVAVLPSMRRMGIGRALVARALADAGGAVLSVAESNAPARRLYRSLGFTETLRRTIWERPHG
jgi:ribosomal protein S18 acetylase RimI-like enzyme